jgi:hypothetical protein
MMESLFSWEVASVVVALLISIGLGVLALDDFRLARLSFLLAAAYAIGGVAMRGVRTDLPPWGRIVLVFSLTGIIGVAALYSLTYVDKKQKAKERLSNRQPPIEKTVKFAVMIPFDTAPDSTPIPLDENPDDPLFRTYQDMASLAMNGTVPETAREAEPDGQITWRAKSVSTQDAPTFLGRLLQYYVFECIDSLQRNSLRISIGYPAEANAGIEPPDAEPYPYEKLSQELAGNLFFKPFLHRPSSDEMNWKLKSVSMPKGTEIKFLQISNPDKYVVRFQKPEHFNVDFMVEGFAGTGVGQVPKHFVTQRARTTMQWPFFVTMHYSIEHSDDNSFNPNSYAQWLDALYDGLHRRLVVN